MSTVPAHILASIDQERALLARMVEHVRAHQQLCDVADSGACVGLLVFGAIKAAPRRSIETALILALGHLAQLPVAPSTIDGIDVYGAAHRPAAPGAEPLPAPAPNPVAPPPPPLSTNEPALKGDQPVNE